MVTPGNRLTTTLIFDKQNYPKIILFLLCAASDYLNRAQNEANELL